MKLYIQNGSGKKPIGEFASEKEAGEFLFRQYGFSLRRISGGWAINDFIFSMKEE